MAKKINVNDIVYHKTNKNIAYVIDDFGDEVRIDTDGVVPVNELELYDPGKRSHKNAILGPSTEYEIKRIKQFREGKPVKPYSSMTGLERKSYWREYWRKNQNNNSNDEFNYGGIIETLNKKLTLKELFQ